MAQADESQMHACCARLTRFYRSPPHEATLGRRSALAGAVRVVQASRPGEGDIKRDMAHHCSLPERSDSTICGLCGAIREAPSHRRYREARKVPVSTSEATLAPLLGGPGPRHAAPEIEHTDSSADGSNRNALRRLSLFELETRHREARQRRCTRHIHHAAHSVRLSCDRSLRLCVIEETQGERSTEQDPRARSRETRTTRRFGCRAGNLGCSRAAGDDGDARARGEQIVNHAGRALHRCPTRRFEGRSRQEGSAADAPGRRRSASPR